nr:Predicted carbamoyl transferase, NodU family (COG2192) [uncultured Mediterranean phage uvMED]
MIIAGFQSGHDVGYCLLKDGIPIIHEELERFIREKEPLGDGLEMLFHKLSDEESEKISHFTYGNPGGMLGKWASECGKKEPRDKMNNLLNQNGGEFFVIGHHQSHAANAFFSSNYDEALIITIDGSGTDKSDWKDVKSEATTENSFSTAFTFWKGSGLDIEPIERIPMQKLTIGSPWRIYTREIFGLSSGHPHGLAAGTVMAMASVGDSKKYWKDFYNAFMAGGGGPSSSTHSNVAKYKPIAERSEQDAFDVAAGIQKATEVVGKEIMTPYIEKYNPKHICMSGGVVLNSVMIGKMYDWFPNVEQIYVCPVPYDGGLAIGSAQYVYHQVLRKPRVKWSDNCSPYLGALYNREDIENALSKYENKIRVSEVNDEDVVNLLVEQKIISIFGGGSESGRRALGNRSILCDPRSPDMKDTINEKVKHRQWFRPFAPSILREKVSDWFHKDIDSPYMTTVLDWKEEVKDRVPAVVHLNGTARLQTVTENDNEWYYNFIKKFEDKTGVPIVLNTSFNDREPIVETPEHAINCFMGTNIDYLYFREFNILVFKN